MNYRQVMLIMASEGLKEAAQRLTYTAGVLETLSAEDPDNDPQVMLDDIRTIMDVINMRLSKLTEPNDDDVTRVAADIVRRIVGISGGDTVGE